jgi:hypothetical protein
LENQRDRMISQEYRRSAIDAAIAGLQNLTFPASGMQIVPIHPDQSSTIRYPARDAGQLGDRMPSDRAKRCECAAGVADAATAWQLIAMP